MKKLKAFALFCLVAQTLISCSKNNDFDQDYTPGVAIAQKTGPEITDLVAVTPTTTLGGIAKIKFKAVDKAYGIELNAQSHCTRFDSKMADESFYGCGTRTALGGDWYEIEFTLPTERARGEYVLTSLYVANKRGTETKLAAFKTDTKYVSDRATNSEIPVVLITVN